LYLYTQSERRYIQNCKQSEETDLKFITWNINGLRANLKKGLDEYALLSDADIIAFQETKVNQPTAIGDYEAFGYQAVFNCAERNGYSGTVCLFRHEPILITHGLGNKKLDTEGRLITLSYPDFYFVNVYVPNSQGERERWYYRLDWDSAFAEYLADLQIRKPVIVGGDFNVARDYIDIYPENSRNEKEPLGFTSEERGGFENLLSIGLVDIFRELHPTQAGAYTWWIQKNDGRANNRGRRLDYFLVSKSMLPKVKSCVIRSDIFGSDHCPVEMVVDI
jgi:exodeoxyribonuclease-3